MFSAFEKDLPILQERLGAGSAWGGGRDGPTPVPGIEDPRNVPEVKRV